MTENEKTRYWLWLVMVFGVANVKTLELVQMHDTLKELYYVLHDPDCSLLNEKERQNVRRIKLEQSENIMTYCEKNGIGIMTWDSDLYPQPLRNIYNPPVVLFYRGNPALLHDQMLLTVVGTRRPSPYSMRVSEWLCRDLCRCGIVLVSGCAVGLDASAHRTAIEEGVPTIAVLGCGVDYDYPKENRALKQKIVENGLLLTEYFPGTPPNGYHFPVRNRILSGISEAVLVVEAGAKSGALITANLACEQGKHVFCVPPGDLFDARYSGVVNFLRDGAYPVFNYLDILYTYYLTYPYKLTLYTDEKATRTQDSLIFSAQEQTDAPRKSVSGRMKVRSTPVEDEPKNKQPVSMEGFTQEHQNILDLLKKGGQNTNAICCMLDMEFQHTTVLMMELEMAGFINNVERDVFELADHGGDSAAADVQ